MATYTKQMQRIVDDYRSDGQTWPAETKVIAAWAMRTGRWKMPESAAIRKCADDLATAMREQTMTDARGRHVRLLHPATVIKDGKQNVFWDDMRTAPRSHMLLSFQQRRKSVVGDCRQLQLDVDCYNSEFNDEDAIIVEFDFTMDLAELDAADDIKDEVA